MLNIKSVKNTSSRRYFLKTAGSLLGGAVLGLWGLMVHSQQKNKTLKTVRVSLNGDRPVLFLDDCIVINQKEQPVVLSSYCTHLGCRIQTYENGQLICPCHGSTFDLEGTPTKGPATRSLEKLAFTFNPKTKTVTIEI